MTEKLYYKDSHMSVFEAVVTSCEKIKNGYAVVLDRTAFFPEGGGQAGDTGYLNDVRIFDTHEKNNEVLHYAECEIETGTAVAGKIDWDRRFRFMQNHSGEHIVSGIINEVTGFNNVGFHLGDEVVTIDFDGEISHEVLAEVELRANTAVYENRNINTYFPTAEELHNFNYRSKLDLTENVRIVEVEGYDTCACCAPHVSRTGEIGIIKLLDTMRHRGGIRINMVCGYRALEDYNKKYSNIAAISASLSAKQHETAAAVERVKKELSDLKLTCSALRRELIAFKASELEKTAGNMVIFEESLEPTDLRELVNVGVTKCGGVCAAFTGNDKDGYNYVIGSSSVDLRQASKSINAA
ncbi:MAG: alanyl-tRNA editing protein, partial [Oscillospiraceae bacterium]|nr:alanyl-tRNA editing protein [Oscillospiraceae bacterium]